MNDPKVFKLGIGNVLGMEYPRNDVVLEFQGHRLVLSLWLRQQQQQYGVGSNSMSAF